MEHEKINYLELPANDIEKNKAFFSAVFNWQFTDYGPEYTAFSASEAGLDGGFYLSKTQSTTESGAALIVFYSNSLSATQAKVEQHGGRIMKPTFSFPGGQRFHFADPCGNEFAVWSDKD